MSFTNVLEMIGGGEKRWGKEPRSQWLKTQTPKSKWLESLSLSLHLSSCVTLGKLLSLLWPQFHHLLNGDNNSLCLLELL